ncbi:50S ribosome-binding GTPase [Streptosporangium subroseum]|uniref:50S ribosome-binding GTPase n=1 Tax=Streptosporangium subroseum TaxID=106412 RepID=A0A239NDQ9_9ACTN|nr:GTPase [Streptosporangium subroseum]SNT52900.1 50S ribosome-binding GTPase [Streptosporangium subroseum]
MKLLRRKKSVSLDDRLAGLEQAADLADGRLGAEAVSEARSVVSRAGVRRSLSVDHTAVALAGATGSGKSSLFNLLSGTSLATVGVTRPTTSIAQAALWEGTGAGSLLDWLEIPRRHEVSDVPPAIAPRTRNGGQAGIASRSAIGETGIASRPAAGEMVGAIDPSDGEAAGLILLDLPDHDSIELSHRLEVDRLVELVDLLVWVLDPQKYADGVVHERYLRPLARHRDVMVVVLNQIDRLSPAAVERCLKDLRRLLDDDGLTGVPVVGVSTRTGAGVSELRSLLTSRVSDRRSWATRLAADVGTAADTLVRASIGMGTADEPSQEITGEPAGSVAVSGSGHGGGRGSGSDAGADRGSGRGSGSGAGRGSGSDAEMPVNPPEVSVDRLARPLTDALSEAAGVRVVVEAVAKAHRHRSVAATGWPITRWIRRFRPDPLRRLHLGTSPNPRSGDAVGRSSMPATTVVQRSRMDTAIREAAGVASAGLPRPWAVAVRQAARSHGDELEDGLDRAVAATTLGVSRRPRWWRAVGLAQWLVLAAMIAGGVWLLGLVGMDYLRLPQPFLPTVGDLPWPTFLLIGGVLLGLVIALLSRVAAWLGGRRRARRAAKALRASVDQVARKLVLEPVDGELSRYRRFVEAITVARDGG